MKDQEEKGADPVQDTRSAFDQFMDEIADDGVSDESDDSTDQGDNGGSAGDKKPEGKEGDGSAPGDEDDLKVPFHKHPRWMKAQKELEAERERNNRIEDELKTMKEQMKNDSGDGASDEIPAWFSRLYADPNEARVQYQDYLKEAPKTQDAFKDAVAAEVERQLSTLDDRKSKKQEEQDAWLDTQLSELETAGESFDREKLIEVMAEYAPTTEGNLDFSKGLKILKTIGGNQTAEDRKKQKQVADARKNAADLSNTGGGGGEGDQDDSERMKIIRASNSLHDLI